MKNISEICYNYTSRSIGQKHIVTETTSIQGISYILRSSEVHS